MLRAQHIAVITASVKIHQVVISSGVRLLVVSPVEIVQRIVVHLADALEKDAEVKAVPFRRQVYPEAQAWCNVPNDRQIFRIVYGSALLDNVVAIQVLILRPSGHDIQRTPGDNSRFIQCVDFFLCLEKTVAAQSPDLTQLLSFIVLRQASVRIVEACDIGSTVGKDDTGGEAQRLSCRGKFVIVTQRELPSLGLEISRIL